MSRKPRPVSLPDESDVPHSIESERALLGSILVSVDSAAAFRRAAAILEPDDFFDQRHRLIFKAMKSLHARSIAIDTVTLVNALREQTE